MEESFSIINWTARVCRCRNRSRSSTNLVAESEKINEICPRTTTRDDGGERSERKSGRMEESRLEGVATRDARRRADKSN